MQPDDQFMKLFQRLNGLLGNSAPPVFDSPLAPSFPFYVIGDVHGCDHLLEDLLEKIDAEEEGRGCQIVCVGDYVDRGENSAGVLRRLHELCTSRDNNVTCLMGNHEDMMLAFLDNPERSARQWFRNGGLQTLGSFRIGGISQNMSGTDLIDAHDQLQEALGTELAAWLRALPTTWSNGNVTVVHAGANPDVSLTKQSRKNLIWGHPEFLKTPRRDGQWVVHGHTILPEIKVEQGRIGVDTGAYATGCLSAAYIAPSGMKILTTTK